MDVLTERKGSAHEEHAAGSLSPLGMACVAAGVLACLAGLVPAVQTVSGGPGWSARFDWDASHGPFAVGLDPLSAFFLVPVLALSALAAVYGADYLRPYRATKSLGWSWLF